jgi:MFS family permease
MTVAGTLLPIAAGALGEGGAFRPFLLYLLAFPVWWAARRLPEPAHAPSLVKPGQHLREALADLRQRGRLSDFLGLLPMGFLSLGVYLGLSQALFPLFLEREFGLGALHRGLLLAVGTAAASIASALSGRVSGRVQPSRAVVGGLTLEVAGFLTIGLAPPLWAVALGLGLVGAGYGSLTPVLQHFATSAGHDRYRGALVGTWVSGNRVGMFTGPSVSTALASSLGDRNTYLAGAGVVALMAVALVPVRRLAARRMHRAAGPSGPGSDGPLSRGAGPGSPG